MMRQFQFSALLLFFVFAMNFGALAAGNNQVPVHESITTTNGPLGVWDYEVTGTEDAYRKGVLFVRLENGEPIVEVHLGNGMLNGQDIDMQGDTLKFMVNLDGVERVAVVLKVNEDTMIGEASSSQGSFAIKGTRKLPPQ